MAKILDIQEIYDSITEPSPDWSLVQGDKGQFIIFESGAEKYRNHRGKYPTDTAFKGNIE